jgi:DNA-directed RNA polymerase I and III subunit RPAC2
VDALEKGFNDLMDLCDVVADKFTAVREDFASQMES